MKPIVFENEYGKLRAVKYLPSDFKTTKLRGLITDIFNNLPEFSTDIVFIIKASAKEGYTITDILSSFMKKSGYVRKSLVFTQAGILSNVPESVEIKISDGVKMIDVERKYIKDAGFKNIIFNRRMSLTFGNPEIFIYKNSISDEFINSNMGTDEKYIIRRVNE